MVDAAAVCVPDAADAADGAVLAAYPVSDAAAATEDGLCSAAEPDGSSAAVLIQLRADYASPDVHPCDRAQRA